MQRERNYAQKRNGNNHILYLLTKTTRCHPKVTASFERQMTGKNAAYTAIVDRNYKPISN